MLRFAALGLSVLLAACGVNQPPAPEPPLEAPSEVLPIIEIPREEGVCTEPRPQICTMEYQPVCALREDGQRETMSSPCNACADVAVVRYTPGACDTDA